MRRKVGGTVLRKFLVILGALLISCTSVLAAKLPKEVQDYIYKTVPGTDVRFDGVVILPDNTLMFLISYLR